MSRLHRRVLCTGAIMLFSPRSVQSQQASPYRDVVVTVQDSVGAVRAAVGEFSRDLRIAESDSILARGSRLRARCQGAASILPNAIERIQDATRSGRARHQATSLLVAMRSLEFALKNCVGGFSESAPGERADTLRAWGVFRTHELEQSIRLYLSSANRFAEASGFNLPPIAQPQ